MEVNGEGGEDDDDHSLVELEEEEVFDDPHADDADEIASSTLDSLLSTAMPLIHHTYII